MTTEQTVSSKRQLVSKGVFITFEGIDGSGKSTQLTLLADYLRTKGMRVMQTREPGGTRIGDSIRSILLDPKNRLDPIAELLLYGAGRAQHIKDVILPALAAGEIVLCDRFSDATLAYQGYGRGIDRQKIASLDLIATSGLKPDLTILLDLDAKIGLERALSRNSAMGLMAEARFENEEMAFHERVRAGYLAMAREDPGRICMVDASGSPHEVQMAIRKIVEERLGSQLAQVLQ